MERAVVVATAAVPACVASFAQRYGIQYGLFVSTQNNGGYVGYQGSNNTASGLPGAYGSNSGFWFSAPTNNVATGSDYISGSTATLLKGATFVTDVECTYLSINRKYCGNLVCGYPYRDH